MDLQDVRTVCKDLQGRGDASAYLPPEEQCSHPCESATLHIARGAVTTCSNSTSDYLSQGSNDVLKIGAQTEANESTEQTS